MYPLNVIGCRQNGLHRAVCGVLGSVLVSERTKAVIAPSKSTTNTFVESK